MKNRIQIQLRSASIAFLAAAAFSFILSSCGVRGRPEAPLTPPEIGRGEPGFKRASDEFKFPNVPSSSPTPAPRATGSGDGH